jgi:AcrR family transcriptional regulator
MFIQILIRIRYNEENNEKIRKKLRKNNQKYTRRLSPMPDVQYRIRKYIIDQLEFTGIHNIKVKHLTDDLNISRSTFYTYYDSTFAALQDVEDDFFEDLLALVRGFWSLPLDRKYFKTPHPYLLKGFRFLSENRRVPAILWGPYGDMRFQYKCKKNIEEVFFPPEIAKAFYPINTNFHTHYAVGGLLDIINHWVQNDCPLSAEELAMLAYKKMFSDIIHTLYPKDRKIATANTEWVAGE